MILETRHLHVYALFHEMLAIHVWDVLNCRSLRMMKLALHYCLLLFVADPSRCNKEPSCSSFETTPPLFV